MVRFGLLGAGRIGNIHGSNIAAADGAKLVALADASRAEQPEPDHLSPPQRYGMNILN